MFSFHDPDYEPVEGEDDITQPVLTKLRQLATMKVTMEQGVHEMISWVIALAAIYRCTPQEFLAAIDNHMPDETEWPKSLDDLIAQMISEESPE